MHSIILFTLIASFLAVQGFDQCPNPSEDGTRLTADHLCRRFCSQMCTKPSNFGKFENQGQQNSWTTTTSTRSRVQAARRNQNRLWQDHLACRKRCVNDLASMTTCDHKMLKQSLSNACLNAQSSSVCLTSCNCCSTTSTTCMQSCHQNNNHQPDFQGQSFPAQGFQGQEFQGSQFGAESQNKRQDGSNNDLENQKDKEINDVKPNFPGNQNQINRETEFGIESQAGQSRPDVNNGQNLGNIGENNSTNNKFGQPD